MKRNLILTILACSASLALCPALHAQDAAAAPSTTGTEAGQHQWGHHGGGGEMMLQRLTKELDLTADQQAKIKPILEATRTQMQANRQDTTLTPQEKMAKNKELRDSQQSQIKALLTPDQQTKYEALIEKMHAHRAAGESSPAASAAATP